MIFFEYDSFVEPIFIPSSFSLINFICSKLSDATIGNPYDKYSKILKDNDNSLYAIFILGIIANLA